MDPRIAPVQPPCQQGGKQINCVVIRKARRGLAKTAALSAPVGHVYSVWSFAKLSCLAIICQRVLEDFPGLACDKGEQCCDGKVESGLNGLNLI